MKLFALPQSWLQTGLPHPWRNSLGSRLFLYVLSGALLGLGGMAYFFYQVAESRAAEQIQGMLERQVQSVEGQLGQIELEIVSLAAAAKTLRLLGIQNDAAYRQLSFEFFQQRPPLVMGLGFGQTPFALVRDRQWYWPYFYVDQGVPGAVGQLLPAPNQKVRFSDLMSDDNYPEKPYYTVPVAAGKTVWLEPYDWYGITMTSCLYPFRGEQGQLLGVVGADVNVTALSEQINQPVTRGGGYFAILSAEGRLLAYPPDPQKAKLRTSYQEIPQLQAIWAQLQQGRSGLVPTQDTFWAYERIPRTDWLMVAAVPRSLVLGPVLAITVGGAIGAGVVLALVVAVFVRRLNARLQPILEECHKLSEMEVLPETSESTGTASAGSITPPRRLDLTGLDEIAVLTVTFEQVTQQLRESFAALESANDALELRVEQRTQQLQAQNLQLEETLQHLQKAQIQLVQSEKMSSLGQLVAGVAHEINNPVNFIYGNLTHAQQYAEDLLMLLRLYQTQFPKGSPAIDEQAAEMDLEFVEQDLPKLIASMRVGVDRIREIVRSLRNFSRLDEAEIKAVDIHEGLESTLMILQNRFKAQPEHPKISVIKEYGQLPLVECYGGQLNQVFMNILTNALDALEEVSTTRKVAQKTGVGEPEMGTDQQLSNAEWEPTIRIQTQLVGAEAIAIRIADNGPGIPLDVQQRLLDPFFTTKPVGKGTGLGMSISYQIVVDRHGGSLQCFSAPGQGAEFIIEIPVRQPVHPKTAEVG